MKKKTITLEDAHRMLDEQFQRARQQAWIEKPLAWALYQVWRDVDADEEVKSEERRVKREMEEEHDRERVQRRGRNTAERSVANA